ncbi:MAG TPA: rod shape-determining protein MreC [Saprospiraceae bacterium]|nr:rod shape-determining protein MreC [Saprospiraceae bacterium]
MSSLRDLLNRPGAVGVFIILQIICLLTIVYANERQGKIFFGATNSIAGQFNEGRSNLVSRLEYKERYDSLQGAYIELLEQQPNAFYDNRVRVDSLHGDSALQQKYEYYPAQVIKNSVTQKDNYLIINKGSQHHIEPHMGVITRNGVVGVVVATNSHYSRVLSLLHNRSRVTAQIKRLGIDGALIWKGSSPKRVSLEGIPGHYTLELGDTVVTSTASRIFPPDLLIGTVKEFELPSGNSTYNVSVALHLDMRRLNDVYVVKNLHRSLIEEIESSDRE